MDDPGSRPASASEEEVTLLVPGAAIPLRFVEAAGGLYVLGKDAAARWPTGLLRRGSGQILRAGRPVPVRAELVTREADRRVRLAEFEAKYGPERFRRWFPDPGRLLRLEPDASAPRDPSEAYRNWLIAEFDAVAPLYADQVQANPIERYARRLSVALLRRRLGGCRHLLEIGPGVGVETLPLLTDGHEVTTIDVSPEMLRRLVARATTVGVADRLHTRALAAAEVGRLARAPGPEPFGGAFSTFGALNCEPELAPVARGLAELLPAGSPLVTGIFNRAAVSDALWGLLTLDGKKFLARRASPVPVGRSRFAVDYYPRSIREMRAAFDAWFRLETVQGFPFLIPPPDRLARGARLWDRLPGVLGVDAALGRRPRCAAFADHLWLTWVRRDAS